MKVDPKLVEVLKRYETEINNNNFVALIADVYLNCGAKGVGELKELFSSAGIDMKTYNRAIAGIVKDLLKNSDLLNDD